MEYSRFTVEEHENFVAWLQGVAELRVRVAMVRRLDRLRRGSVGGVQSVGGGVFALEVEGVPGACVFVHRSGPQITVLHGALDAGEAAVNARLAMSLARGVYGATVHDARAAV